MFMYRKNKTSEGSNVDLLFSLTAIFVWSGFPLPGAGADVSHLPTG